MEATMPSHAEASAAASDAQEPPVEPSLGDHERDVSMDQEEPLNGSGESVEAEQSDVQVESPTDVGPPEDLPLDDDSHAEAGDSGQANAAVEDLPSADILGDASGDSNVDQPHEATEQHNLDAATLEMEDNVPETEDAALSTDSAPLLGDAMETASEAVEPEEPEAREEPEEFSGEREDSMPAQQEDEDSGDEDVRHHGDEYDPANPSHETDEYDPALPDNAPHAQDEYDPANPSENRDNESESKPPPSSPLRKRKLSDTPTVDSAASPAPSASSARSPKRSRNGAPNKPDQRGLKDSAWDRLMDFESTGEFRIAQVSRAAFTSISLLPEFAQCAIVARFTRTPMKEIRDKNGLIMRLHNEYLVENPHIRSLQPVSTFIAELGTDPGLFQFGYAPPVPKSGMSSVKIPYRKDKPGVVSTPSVPSASPPKLKPSVGSATSKPKLDEFGREVKSTSPAKPNLASQNVPSGEASANPTQLPASAPTGVGKPSDPRRRRTGGTDVTAGDTSRAPASGATAQIEKSDVYNRLPPTVKSRLDDLIAARRLPEAINDNVLSRLNHLPESTAITAIDKFAESDLGQVGNINGFLVGIINRVQDRTQPSDPRVCGPISHSIQHNAPGTSQHEHPGSQQQHLSHQSSTHATGYTAMGPSHSLEQTGTNSRDSHSQQPRSSAHVGHGGQNASRHAAPNGVNTPWNPPFDQVKGLQPGAGRFSDHPTIDRAISALPVSVQNHLVSLVNSRILPSLDDLSEKCYEVLGQLSEGLANDVLKRFGTADLRSVRNLSAFLVGVINKCRQEYGFN